MLPHRSARRPRHHRVTVTGGACAAGALADGPCAAGPCAGDDVPLVVAVVAVLAVAA